MKTRYSPSKISIFDNCRLAYKYQYIDGLKSEIESIENFRGNIVHKVLEKFYKLIKGGVIKPLEWVLSEYEELWNKNYTGSIKIVKKEFSPQDYFERGKQCLIDYYKRYTPFNQAKIVDTERMYYFDIEYNGATYSFCGKLDRLDWNDKTNTFEIHDYKVTSTLITQEEADSDWQLGIYYIALKERWPDINRVKLVWHSLLFNKEIVSYRENAQIDEFKKKIIEKVKEIESCTAFLPQRSTLCDWCDFQNICPLWKHPKAMEGLSVNEYKKDPGVKLVARYVELERIKNELKEKIQEIEKEQEEIKEAAIEFAEKENILVIDGPENQLKVEIKDEWLAPTKKENPQGWQNLRDLLKSEGKYEEVSTVNSKMIDYMIKYNKWPSAFIEKVKKFLNRRIKKSVRLIKK